MACAFETGTEKFVLDCCRRKKARERHDKLHGKRPRAEEKIVRIVRKLRGSEKK